MANVKITSLAAYTTPETTDVMPIVDVTTDTTKKVAVGEIVAKVTGDVDIATDGTSSITAGAIVNADVNANAEIAVSKLADGTARQLLQTDSAGTGVEWTSNVDVPGTLDVTGATTLDSTLQVVGNTTIEGNLTVEGTTTTIETTKLLVEDKNIEMGVVGTPTDTTADGGGITLKGTTDKTINWVNATDAWTSSEHIDLASGKEFYIDGNGVLNATTLGSGVVNSSLTSVGTISSGTWQGTAIDDTYLATISAAGKVSNSATTATSANTASAIVARDASGDFSAGTITAALTGNADTATALSSNRAFAVTGDVTGTVSSDLTAGASIATSIAAGVIVNDDINAAAAIAGTKIDPDFGSQTVETTGVFSAAGGAEATPSIAFTGDLNTGIYSPGADQVAISTNGTGRLFVDSSGNVLLNDSASVTSNVSAYLRIRQANAAADTSIGIINAQNSDANATVKIKAGQATRNGGEIVFGRENGSDWGTTNLADGYIAFSPVLNNTNTEALRIDSSGRVGIGTSVPQSLLECNDSSNDLQARFGTLSAARNPIIRLQGRNAANTQNCFTDIKLDSENQLLILSDPGATGGSIGQNPVVIDSSGKVGVGTTSPDRALHVQDDGEIILAKSLTGNALIRVDAQSTAGADAYFWVRSSTTGTGALRFGTNLDGDVGWINYDHSDNSMAFRVNGNERARIDSSGRLLVGTSTALTNVYYSSVATAPSFQLEGSTVATSSFSLTNTAANNGGTFTLQTGSSGNSPSENANTGIIQFNGFDGTNYRNAARISCAIDGTPGSNDMPGRLTFSTTADGASSATERMRITSDGTIRLLNSPGIDFSGTSGVTGVTSEVLDDYEKGTFTPKYLTSSGGNAGISHLIQNGDYVKIGNLVYVSIQLATDSWTTGVSGIIYITDFPFQISTTGLNTGGAFNIAFRREFATDKGANLTARFVNNLSSSNGTTIYLYDHATTSVGNNYLVDTDFMDGASENYIYGSGWYFTDS